MLGSGDRAPSFSLDGVADPWSDGPAVLVFFKVTCPVCQLAAPKVQLLADGGARVVAVGEDPPEKLEKYAAKYGQRVPTVKDSTTEISFENGSSLQVGTSHRGGTLQILHVSEYGKISALAVGSPSIGPWRQATAAWFAGRPVTNCCKLMLPCRKANCWPALIPRWPAATAALEATVRGSTSALTRSLCA